jgi:hypothetical protein
MIDMLPELNKILNRNRFGEGNDTNPFLKHYDGAQLGKLEIERV